jgi:DMSO/TMAO reductase YedYZ molybdopterin-dependent catalytic subunit
MIRRCTMVAMRKFITVKPRLQISRRSLILGGGASLVLTGCDQMSASPTFQKILATAEGVNYRAHRMLIPRTALAPEFGESDIAKTFRPNGSQDVYNLPPEYREMGENGYADWRLRVGGMVTTPLELSLADLRALPARTQITRHDCVEGWSCIGKWTGPQLSLVLDRAGLQPEARFIVFHCADEVLRYIDGEHTYYESIDLIDAFHPQTILAYDLNGAPLPFANGAPLRLRVERQLGYKSAKFLTRIEAVDRLDNIRGGKGGYWEDDGYEWYAGI